MSQQVTERPQVGDVPGPRDYAGAALRHVALPLGGIGTGQVALCGDGGLRQWQIHNQINHLGFLPDSFFAIRASCAEPPLDVIRVLQSRETLDRAHDPTPLVTDDHVPADQIDLLTNHPGVERTRFRATYPFARIDYLDEALPLDLELEAYTPFVPLDAEASGYPAATFTFTLRNRLPHAIHGGLAASLQNAVGWDGITPIAGNRCPLYGGNTNRVRRRAGTTAIVMENPSLPDDHPGAGQMALTALSPGARPYERWTTPAQFLRFIEGFNASRHLVDAVPLLDGAAPRSPRNTPLVQAGPSADGTTWNGGLLVPFWLEPGATTTVSFVLSWYFPNRYVNFDQFGEQRDYGRSRFWLGNAYATRFADAVDVAEQLIERRNGLEAASRAWETLLSTSTLPGWLTEALAAQGSLIRSPTCFQTEDGRFYGFEGSLGASTAMWNGTFGGSCPLNCTHVWNYEQALAKLFPSLERSMRETDLDVIQAPEGYIPHRTILPLFLRQFWDEPIGGPTNPALDGMLGTVLKVYREVRQGAGDDWRERHWPRVRRLIDYVLAKWDDDDDGVLQGEQPNTYDIAFYGPNMYIGALWLAALRAGEELARLSGESTYADRLRDRFERGSRRYDELLWNGEFYIQLLDESAPPEDQFGTGCLADQLFGQWWAHLLDLGYLLPVEHVRTTLRSIVRYNVRRGFEGFEHGFRVFADRDDWGLLVCTWPHGGRPAVPVRYCDEVWTGMEYQVGAHCIIEGMVDEGLELIAALRQRYAGTRRNPFNEIECGDHYARAMAGWSVLEAISGLSYDATRDAVRFAPATGDLPVRMPVVLGTGWGTFEQTRDPAGVRTELRCVFGQMRLQSLTLAGAAPGTVMIEVAGAEIPGGAERTESGLEVMFSAPVTLGEGTSMVITVSP